MGFSGENLSAAEEFDFATEKAGRPAGAQWPPSKPKPVCTRKPTRRSRKPKQIRKRRRPKPSRASDLGLFNQMEKMPLASLQVARSRLGEEHPAVAAALAWLGDAQRSLGRVKEAEVSIQDSLARYRKLKGNESLEVADDLHALALLFWGRGTLDEAERMVREAVAIEKKQRGNDHPLALVLRDQRKLTESEQVFRESLAVNRKALRDESPAVMLNLCNLALVVGDEGRLDEAVELHSEALRIARKILGNEHPYIAWTADNLGGILRKQGKLAEAESLQREALALRRKLFGNEHPDVALSLNSVANTLLDQNRLDEAQPLYREALAVRRKIFGGRAPGGGELAG